MNRLEAKMIAVNRANAYADELYKMLAPIFAPFVGKKVETTLGHLVVKVEKLLPSLPYTPALSVHRIHSEYSLVWAVKTCESVDGLAVYHDTTVYIGSLSQGFLTALIEPQPLRTDYTAEEVLEKRRDLEAARIALDKARTDLYPFGERDQ